MRKVVLHMQMTLNGRIAHGDVFSTTLEPAADRVVLRGDPVAELLALKARPGGDILLSGGPRTIGPLADTPGVIDEYLISLHPAVVATGPQLFEGLTADLALRLVETKAFEGGCVILRYFSRDQEREE